VAQQEVDDRRAPQGAGELLTEEGHQAQ